MGTFRDYLGETLFNASMSSSACEQRAEDYYTWCGNTGTDKPTTATHYPSMTQATFPNDAGCFVEIDFCATNPAISGDAFRDYWAENNMDAGRNQAACLQRAEDFFDSCGGDYNLVRVEATFKPTGQSASYPPGPGSGFVPSSQRDKSPGAPSAAPSKVYPNGYECHIIQTQCARNSKYQGSFVETTRDERCAQISNKGFRNACDQNVCLGRAKIWHEWCRNPLSAQTTSWHKASTWFATWPELTNDIQESMESLAREAASSPDTKNSNNKNNSKGTAAWQEFLDGRPPASSTDQGRAVPSNEKSYGGSTTYSPPSSHGWHGHKKWGHHYRWGHAWWGWLVAHHRRKYGG